VLEQEPPDADEPLLKLDNVIVTPHSAFYSEESLVELQTRTAQAALAVLKGEMPESVVNPEVLSKNRAGVHPREGLAPRGAL